MSKTEIKYILSCLKLAHRDYEYQLKDAVGIQSIRLFDKMKQVEKAIKSIVNKEARYDTQN